MHYMKLLTSNYRIIILSLIAATVAMFALLAASPPVAEGSSRSVVEGWDTISPAPQTSLQQVNPDIPSTMQECREEQAAGNAVVCGRDSFSIETVRPSGEYHIDWSVWASGHDNVDRYTVQRLRFMYRYNFEREDDGTAVNSWDYTIPDVNSCVPRAAETDSRGSAIRWAWTCDSIGQVHEDPFGAPTSIEQLQVFDDNWTSTSWTGSLQAPGRKHDIPVQALRIPGSWADVHADNPQSRVDRLTQQQVSDGTVDLLYTDVEMHLYLITVHFDDGTTQRQYDLITGGPFADR